MKKKTALIWLSKRVRRRIPAILLMCLAHIGQAVLGVLFALGSRNVIDSAVAGLREDFIHACIVQAAIIVGLLLCLAIYRHLHDRLQAELDRDWKKNILHGLLHGDYSEVSAYHSAELLNRLNNDVRIVDEGILGVLPGLSAMLVRVVAAVAVLAALDGRFTLIIVALGLAAILVTGLLRRKIKELHKRVAEHNGKVSALLQEAMEKLLMVQAMDASDELEQRSDQLLDRRYEAERKRKNVSLGANMGVSLLSYGLGFVALVWCAFRLLLGQMTFGSLTAITQLVTQLQSPFVGLSGIIPKYMAMLASAERLMELEEIQGEPEPVSEDAQELYERMESICAERLCFSYDRDKILDDAAFSLPKGSFSVIAGHSGIGKSTLLKLLLGIFKPDSGSLYLKGGETTAIDRSTRRLFAYVPQGNLLLSGTIRENLTIVRPDADDSALEQAIYASAMDEFLTQLPEGLDTVLGESGAGLSEGQAQRLAIARAVLGGAPVLLLDECTSALDEATEKVVLQRLRALPGRTIIAVTHRSAAMELCDLLLELSEGKIHVNEVKAE